MIKTYIFKHLNKILYIIFLFCMSAPILAQQDYHSQRKEFNDKLITSMMNSMMGNSVLVEISRIILYVGFTIGLFNLLSKATDKGFATMFVKWILKAWFVYAIISPGLYSGNMFERKNLLVYIYEEVGAIFDPYAKSLGKEKDLALAIDKVTTLQDNIIQAKVRCNSEDTTCWQNYLQGNYIIQPPAEQTTNGVGEALKQIYTSVQQAFVNPGTFLFPLIMWAVSIIQQFVSYFMLLGMGVITAWAIAALTILSPFALIDGFDSQLKSAFKNVLAAALFNFVTKLIVWISTVIIVAVEQATMATITKQIAGGSGNDSVSVLMIGNFGTITMVLVFQIVAITKIPSIARNIINLSLSQIVNIGEALFGAAMGVMNLVAPSMATVGGNTAKGGAKLLASSIRSSKGGDSKESGGGGGGGAGPSIINSDNLSNFQESANTSNGGSNQNSPFASDQKSIFKNEDKKDKNDKKEKNWRDSLADNIEQGTDLALNASSFAGNVAKDMFSAGFGQGDGLGTLKKGIQNTSQNLKPFETGQKVYGMSKKISNKMFDKGKSFYQKNIKKNSQETSSKLNAEMNTILSHEKTQMNETTKKQYEGLIKKISTNQGNNEDFDNFMRYSNIYDVSKISGKDDVLLNSDFKKHKKETETNYQKELDGMFKKANSNNGLLDSSEMAKLKDMLNKGLVSKESIQKTKGIEAKSEKEYNQLKTSFNSFASTGIGETDVFEYTDSQGKKVNTNLKEIKEKINKVENEKTVSLDDIVEKQIAKGINNDYKKYEEKINNGDFSIKDRKEFSNFVEHTKDRIVGDESKINLIEKALGKKADVGHLKKNDTELMNENTKIQKSLEDSIKNGEQIVFYPMPENPNVKMAYEKGKFQGYIFDNENDGIVDSFDSLSKVQDEKNKETVQNHIKEMQRLHNTTQKNKNNSHNNNTQNDIFMPYDVNLFKSK